MRYWKGGGGEARTRLKFNSTATLSLCLSVFLSLCLPASIYLFLCLSVTDLCLPPASLHPHTLPLPNPHETQPIQPADWLAVPLEQSRTFSQWSIVKGSRDIKKNIAKESESDDATFSPCLLFFASIRKKGLSRGE